MVYDWTKIVQAIYPATCLLCDAPGRDPSTDLCAGCLRDLPMNRPACPVCATPVATPRTVCARCLRRPPPFERTLAPWRYEGALVGLIHRMKDGRLNHARLLGGLLAEQLTQWLDEAPELILPVPAHRARLRERGFNPTIELGRELNRVLGIPMRVDLLRKPRAIPHQSTLGREQRLCNPRGAFTVEGDLRGRHVAVLDDVVTTGATTRELARLLKRHHAQRVDIWAVARTP